MASSTIRRTLLEFQHDAKLLRLSTLVTAVHPFPALPDANRALFKQGTEEDHVVVTEKTIFHPQGGGQPSDEGTMRSSVSSRGEITTFTVSAARMDALNEGQVLHLGRFDSPSSSSSAVFQPGELVEQAVDEAKRLLYSRYHTAGHVLGAATRHLLEAQIEGFDELKASHVPGAASCEFKGLIGGEKKAAIQEKVNDYVAKGMPVEIDWWTEVDFRREGLQRLIPENKLPEGEKYRVVKIVGAEVYPCGGTHVDTTDLCGETTVRKISRSKGVSRVSYDVAF